MKAFQPTEGATKTIAATSVSANVNVIAPGASSGPTQVRVCNTGTVAAFIRKGPDNTVAASPTTDMPIPPGAIEVLTVDVPSSSNGGVWFAAITATGTASVYFTPGVGGI